MADNSQNNPVQENEVQAPVGTVASNLPNFMSDDPSAQLQGTRSIRQLLSQVQSPPIQEAIDAGVIPRAIQFLQRTENRELQYEAAWVLTNIASGSSEHTQAVVQGGAAAPLLQLMISSPHKDVQEQCMWALGNIAGDSISMRDGLLGVGAVNYMLQFATTVTPDSPVSLIQNAAWLMSNLCRGKPAPPLEIIQPLIPVLLGVLQFQSTDLAKLEDAINDAMWCLSYISDGPNERITAIMTTGVTSMLVTRLGCTNSASITPALRCLGNFVSGDDVHTQHVLDHGVIAPLKVLLDHPTRTIRKETMWTFSNITAGTQNQVQMVVDAEVFPIIYSKIDSDEWVIRKEAYWAISNATSGGGSAVAMYLAQTGAVKALVTGLEEQDNRIIAVALEGLQNLLRFGDSPPLNSGAGNPIVMLLQDCGGIEKMEEKTSFPDSSVASMASALVSNYLSNISESAAITG